MCVEVVMPEMVIEAILATYRVKNALSHATVIAVGADCKSVPVPNKEIEGGSASEVNLFAVTEVVHVA